MSSLVAALPITEIDVPGGALLGLMHCPGRCGVPYGQRDLTTDLARIEAWGADALVTFVEGHEFPRLGVPEFAAEARHRRFRWYHVPIPDFGTPSTQTWEAWRAARSDLKVLLEARGRIGLHCAAGLGRTGTIAAKILVERGFSPQAAIAEVRCRRPGAIETAEQQAFVLSGPLLL